MIKNELCEGIEIIKDNMCTEYLVAKLSKSFFKLETDIFLVNVYVKPSNSSLSNNNNDGRDLIRKIKDKVNELKSAGEVILCGDFNSRIGSNPCMIQNENYNNYIPLPDDYEPDNFSPRQSQDNKCNSYAKDFVQLMTHNQLTVLNGRTLGDLKGKFTSIQYQGCSVIDYIATTRSLTNNVNHFKVCNFTEFSDHCPLSMSLKINKVTIESIGPLKDTYDPAPCRLIFNDANKDAFIEIQNSTESVSTINSLYEEIHKNTEISEINKKFVSHLQNISSQCFRKTKNKNDQKSFKSNNPWFNWQVRVAKREVNKAVRLTAHFPSHDFIRQNFYKVKGAYRRVKNKSINTFFADLNSKIEDGNVLNWQAFNKIKRNKTSTDRFDSHDMAKFETFFRQLYDDKHNTINDNTKTTLLMTADNINSNSSHNETLNCEISDFELNSAIKSLKPGKASSSDMISNEILKSLDLTHRNYLLKLFNTCLLRGKYPWNNSIITPLHKKGSKSDPDNYRAVAVSSVIGKLFSTILLERLTIFRKNNHPDPPNQLGFTKKAQTVDHIFTMNTISEKYKKLKKPVYAVFVDFKKAFDSVCRQALFLKLANMGITGNYYNTLRDMYSNSYAHIKLSGYISKKINVKKGTEQGHPLSPDLFKIFLADLSPLLDFKNCPSLANKIISHLLWADDLILLSLDPQTTQAQLDVLDKFCKTWGIEINELKTKPVIFNKKYINVNPEPKFKINGKTLKNVDSYCYLGIHLHTTGSFNLAKDNLRIAATRAFYGLKRNIIRSKISFTAASNLFNSLIKPILLYGAPIWTPPSQIVKNISKAINNTNNNQNIHQDILSKHSKAPLERVHLSFIKWALGVHRKASNVGVWGETGRYPLIYEAIRLTLNYLHRIQYHNKNSLVHLALKEQMDLKLNWYKNVEPLLKIDQDLFHANHVKAFQITNNDKTIQIEYKSKEITMDKGTIAPNKCRNIAHNKIKSISSTKLEQSLKGLSSATPIACQKFRTKIVMSKLKSHFERNWELNKSNSSKLSFYNTCKSKFALEPYLTISKGFSRRYSTTQLRISAHNLEIERGRYTQTPRDKRICKWCKTSMNVDCTENENHVLYNCDLYTTERNKLITRLNKIHSNSINNNLSFTTINLKDTLIPLLNGPTDDTMIMNSVDPAPLIITPNTRHTNTTNTNTLTPREIHHHTTNSICTYIFKCLDTRNKFIDDLRSRTTVSQNRNNITSQESESGNVT